MEDRNVEVLIPIMVLIVLSNFKKENKVGKVEHLLQLFNMFYGENAKITNLHVIRYENANYTTDNPSYFKIDEI